MLNIKNTFILRTVHHYSSIICISIPMLIMFIVESKKAIYITSISGTSFYYISFVDDTFNCETLTLRPMCLHFELAPFHHTKPISQLSMRRLW